VARIYGYGTILTKYMGDWKAISEGEPNRGITPQDKKGKAGAALIRSDKEAIGIKGRLSGHGCGHTASSD
jgi:hypothetical protein